MNPGDSIGPEHVRTMATIACFARRKRDKHPVAVTVMHLVTDAGLIPDASLRFISPSVEQGGSQFVGLLDGGTLVGVDAAAIALEAGVSAVGYIPDIGDLRGTRRLTEADRFIAVRMRGAGTGAVVPGRIESPSVPIPALGLDDAILVSIDVRPGDSGAAIVDNDGHVVGILKGRYEWGNRLAVCTPIESALHALECQW